jgi:2-phospho-L-lactate guanylyltransferase
VLVKDFGDAKQRLGPALSPDERRALAQRNAERAILAASAGDDRIVVAGSEEVAAFAGALGATVFVEPRQEGQNPAAQRGIQHALAHGAGAVLLLSSDLPLIDRDAVRGMLDFAAGTAGPVAIAAPAIGRGGTNALYLRPPGVISLHFGGDSLALFRRDAESRGVPFLLHESAAFALDLDEPMDLARLRRAV